MNRIRIFLERMFPRAVCSWKVARVLRDLGHWRSLQTQAPVDTAGRPIPWYTYPSIEYLRQFDFSRSVVFEFGAGNSTKFWAERAATVFSVEDDSKWFENIEASRRPNQTLFLRPERKAYVSCLVEQGRLFDVIVIDGKWRLACVTAAPDCLAPGGLIILDNSDWFTASARHLRESGFFEIDFSGFGPINHYAWTTSIFVRMSSHLQHRFRDPRPIGGITEQPEIGQEPKDEDSEEDAHSSA